MNNLIATVVMFLIASSNVLAAEIQSSGGEVKFTAIGKPGFLKIKGESKGQSATGHIRIENKKIEGEFEFELEKLDTGIELRNEHMKNKYLEVAKYPKAKFKLAPFGVISSTLEQDIKDKFEGELQLHGVSKKIKGEFTYDAAKKQSISKFEILVSDFKIDIPAYMGVTVSEKVEIEVLSKFDK